MFVVSLQTCTECLWCPYRLDRRFPECFSTQEAWQDRPLFCSFQCKVGTLHKNELCTVCITDIVTRDLPNKACLIFCYILSWLQAFLHVAVLDDDGDDLCEPTEEEEP
jgi:hypothetical protein